MKKTIFIYNKNTKISYAFRDVINTCLSALELYLKNINTRIPDSLTTVLNYLDTLYRKIEDYNASIESDYKILKQYPKFLKACINYILTLVEFKKYNQSTLDDEIEIEVSDLIRTFTHFEYSFVSSLFKIMTQEEAIKFYQSFVDNLTKSRRDPKKYLDNLEDLVNNFKDFSERWHDLEATLLINNEEKLVFKVKKCRWAENLKDFEPKIGYTMMCYQDFERAKNFNPDFLLTRTHTLMEGDDYCDFCYHDTRKNKDLSHPSEKEFKELD
ncbi:MAG: L-2-amino-thiazoline-4-carboxylic acid hydrolase [Promethearchaeota archaeon]